MVAVLLLLVPLVIVQAVAAWRLARAREGAAAARTLEAAQALAASTDAALRELVAAQEAGAAALAARPDRMNPAAYLESLRQHHPALRALAWLPPDGPPLVVTPADASLGGWPRRLRAAGRRYVVTPAARLDDGVSFWLAVPVVGSRGAAEGMLVGQVLVPTFAAAVPMPSPEIGVAVLIDPAGQVAFVAGTPELPPEARDWSRIAPVAAARSGGAAIAPRTILPPDPGERLAAFAPIGETGWVAGVSRSRAAALAAARSGIAWGLLVSTAALGIGLVGAVVLGRRLTRPVERLTAAARAAATGEGPVAVPPGIGEEFGQLARALALAGREARRRAGEIDATRRRLEALLALVSDPAMITDADGRAVALNPAADALLGRPAADREPAGAAASAAGPDTAHLPSVGRTPDWAAVQPLDLAGRPVPPEHFPTVQAIVTGKRATGVIQLAQGSGERRVFGVEAVPLTDSAGRLLGAVTLFRDLTEKREMERRVAELSAELKARTELIEALFARLPAGLALMQGPDLRLRAANSRLFQLAGLSEPPPPLTSGALEGRWAAASRRLTDLFPPAVAAQLSAWIAKARESGGAVRGTDVRVEGFKRGSVYWSYTVTPLREGGGRSDLLLLAIVDTTEDVAARVRAQRAAEQVEQKGAELEAVLQSLTDGVAILDASGRVAAMNRSAERMLGRPAEKGVRPRLEDLPQLARLYEPAGRLIPAEELPSALALAGEAVPRREAYLLTEAHEKRFLSLSASPLRDRGGRLLGAVVTFRDITREKEVESFKLQFIARAAHELRTPLTTIKGNLLLALKGRFGSLAPEQREALETATRSADAMVSLIDDLLDITRIASGRLRLFGEEVALKALLDRTVAGVAALAAGKGIALQVHGDADIVGYWDAAKLEQVFANVLSNAVKFTPTGGRVDIRLFRDARLVTVAVRDTGVGIPRDKLALVFQPFVSLRRREADIPRQRGTGLGLSIAQSIVEAHGGRMWAESEGIGRGTTIYFTLPLDHRRAERARLNLPARLYAGETPIEPSLVADLSAEGAAVVAPTAVLVATTVRLELRTPAGAELTAVGEIVRVEPVPERGQFKAGVQFRALSEADKAVIREWVRRARAEAPGGLEPVTARPGGPSRG